MPEDILTTRIASLKTNLTKITDVLSWFSPRQTRFEQLSDLLEQTADEIDTSTTRIDTYLHRQVRLAERARSVPEDLHDADGAATALNLVPNNLRAVRQDIRCLGRFCSRLTSRPAKFQKITGYFKSQAGDLVQQLDQATAGGAQAWQSYNALRLSAGRLFAEFSEMLAGLALRESGFDDHICEIADELLQPADRPEDVLTMPVPHYVVAHPEQIVAILGNHILLSYPEWTLWSLPMAAYEFWCAYESKHVGVQNAFRDATPQLSIEDRELCLPDVFAVCSMGPAYAYYAILLSLDPVDAFTATGEKPCAARRAEAILTTLTYMNQSDRRSLWSGIIENLRESWNTAVAAANANPAPLPKSVTKGLQDAARTLIHAVDNWTAATFRMEGWAKVQELQQALIQNSVAEFKLNLSYDMRHLVNAAWLVRCANTVEMETLCRSAAVLAERILELREREIGSGRVSAAYAGPLRG